MRKSLLDGLPEAFVSSAALSASVSRAVAAGRLRQIGPRTYSSNLVDPPAAIVRRNLWPLVGALTPGALVADRTAIENAPAADGSIFIVSDRTRNLVLPGLTIRSRRGAVPQPDDKPFLEGLYLCSTARAYLDNMAVSRRIGDAAPRTLSRDEIERRLDDLARRHGAAALTKLRDDARRIAPAIDRDQEYAALDQLIGAILGTRNDRLATDRARARAGGQPFDPDRMALFERLHGELRRSAPVERPNRHDDPAVLRSLAFYEAYFSNFIEGTEFEVDEALGIVFDNRIPANRPQDAHDILGTWRIVSDLRAMRQVPADFDDLIAILSDRHAGLMGARRDKRPGEYKLEPNRAGGTLFVAPDQVRGTLERGLEFRASLETPFARAVYMMFLVAEVHPFDDGNGRIARIMMNAELVAGGDARIVIPTVYRNNYLAALRALSRTGQPEALVRTLDFAQRWTSAVPWSADDRSTRAALTDAHAFLDPVEAEESGHRLRIPAG